MAAISLLLFAQRDKLKGRFDDPIFKVIFVLLGYLLISLPLVEWPGSVIRTNIDTFVRAVVFVFYCAYRRHRKTSEMVRRYICFLSGISNSGTIVS